MLLVLDNCEHLGLRRVGAGGSSAARDPAGAVRVLATSRGVLEVEGEIVWRVHPLAVPPARAREAELRRYDAARLFLERAGRRPGLMWKPQAADVVAVSAGELDASLPLALELAAARFQGRDDDPDSRRGLDDRFGRF